MKGNNNMKRVLAVLLTTIMLLTIVAVSPIIALEVPTFSVSDAQGYAGDEVVLSVNIASNPGVISIGLQIGYDSSVLELKSAAIKDFAEVSFSPIEANPFMVTWEDVLKPNNTNNGSLAVLTFSIKESAPLGDTSVTVDYNDNEADNVFNSDYDNVSFTMHNGKVTVLEKIVDVTGVTIDETLSVNIGEKTTMANEFLPK